MGTGASTADESYVFRQFKLKYVGRVSADTESAEFYQAWNAYVEGKRNTGNYEDFVPVVASPTIETYRSDITAVFESLDRDGSSTLSQTELSRFMKASGLDEGTMDTGGNETVSRAELSAFFNRILARAISRGDVFSFELLLANLLLFVQNSRLQKNVAGVWSDVQSCIDPSRATAMFDKYSLIEKLGDPAAVDMLADMETASGGKVGAEQWQFFWCNNASSAEESMVKVKGWLDDQQRAAQVLQSKQRMRKAKAEVEAKREQQEQSKAALLIQGKSRQRGARKRVEKLKSSA